MTVHSRENGEAGVDPHGKPTALWVNSLITVGSLTAVAGCGRTQLSAIRSGAAAAEPVAKKKKNTVCKKKKKKVKVQVCRYARLCGCVFARRLLMGRQLSRKGW